jgi:hypothetical protein
MGDGWKARGPAQDNSKAQQQRKKEGCSLTKKKLRLALDELTDVINEYRELKR